jgi:hypothetical protein
MKKNNMLDLIQKIILQNSHSIVVSEAKRIANHILNGIERAGMKPPLCERGFDRDGLASKNPPSYRWDKE